MPENRGRSSQAPHVQRALAAGQAKLGGESSASRPPAPHVQQVVQGPWPAAPRPLHTPPQPAVQPRMPQPPPGLAPHVAAAVSGGHSEAVARGTVQRFPAPVPASPFSGRHGRPPSGTVQRMMENKLTWSSKRSRNVAQTVQEIALDILSRRNEDIEMMYDKPGGWELWFQGELYVAMRKNMQLIPLAETKLYGNAQKSDFCFMTADGKELAIELKCEGWQNKDKFVGEVGKDLLKLQQFQGPGYAIQIAISCNTTDDVPIKGAKKVGKFTLHWNKVEA